jgi:hypothetical protein
LQIKEDCYTDITEQAGFKEDLCCISTNGKGKYLIIVYHSRKQKETSIKLCEYINHISDLSKKVRLYSFCYDLDLLLLDFEEAKERIDAAPLPGAIYKAYKKIFKVLDLDEKKVTENQVKEKKSVNEKENELFKATKVKK